MKEQLKKVFSELTDKMQDKDLADKVIDTWTNVRQTEDGRV